MVNVAVVIDKFPQLTETFVARQVAYFNADVITRQFDQALHDTYKYKAKSVNALASERSKLFDTFHKYFLKINSRLWHTPTYYWPNHYHPTFKRYLEEQRIEAVLAQFGPTGINCLSICKALNLRLVVHFHGYDASQLLSNKYYVNDLKRLKAYVHKVVVVNQTMVEELVKIGFAPNQVVNIPYGVPINEFKPVDKDYNAPFHFLSVGRFVPKKSPLRTIEAFEMCADQNYNTQLTMIGDGPLFNEAKSYATNSRHSGRINLLGAKSQTIVKDFLAKAHVFVQHSVTPKNKDAEGWPVSIAEACACGLPVVATAHAGIKDQVIHGETGFLVPEGDYVSMGKYMLKLSQDVHLCNSMSTKTREFIEENGNFQKQAAKLARLINESA